MWVGPLRIKLQLACGEGYALGPGKAELLDAIAAQGSISAAGRALGMSYRRAWLLVDEMNRSFRTPLVETIAGGGQNRGARLSELGRAVLAAYQALDAAAAVLGETPAYAELAVAVRSEPLAPD